MKRQFPRTNRERINLDLVGREGELARSSVDRIQRATFRHGVVKTGVVELRQLVVRNVTREGQANLRADVAQTGRNYRDRGEGRTRRRFGAAAEAPWTMASGE